MMIAKRYKAKKKKKLFPLSRERARNSFFLSPSFLSFSSISLLFYGDPSEPIDR
jgi:hypothetical protein